MDCQTGVVSVYAKPQEEFVERASNVRWAARKSGMSAIHVQVGFRPGLPEVSARNKIFAAMRLGKTSGAAGGIHPVLGPESGDIV
jgi:hypothetical protein